MWSKFAWAFGILLASLALGGGLWGWMTVVAGDQQPQFQSISVDPPQLRFAGGPVTVRAQVTDDTGLRQVSGLVLRGDAPWVQLPARTLAESPRDFTYVAQFQAPGNVEPGGVAMDYSIRLVAVDRGRQEAVGQVGFQVLPPAPPPAPP